jgi:UDP-sulfoquinovose synthase
MIAERTGAEISFVENPRNEAAENELNVINEKFFGHAIEPTTLEEGLMEEVRDIAARYRDRVDPKMIPATSQWSKT